MSTSSGKSNSGSWSVMSENNLNEKFPLHRACRDGDVGALTALLHQQEAASQHITLEDTYYGWTPTHWAAYFGKLECLRVLIIGVGNGVKAHPDLRTSRFTQTPTHIAAFAGHPHCLQWLVQAGANANAQDYLGETPLHKAARTGSTECVSLLSAANIDIKLTNNNGQTAANLANACSYRDLAQFLLHLEGKQGEGAETGGISRSIPAHGLNGGVFPECNTTALTTNKVIVSPQTNQCTSSNGYYGFQPSNCESNGHTNGHNNGVVNGNSNVVNGVSNGQSNGQTNGHSEDCDMETETETVAVPLNNGRTPNGVIISNGAENGVVLNGHSNGLKNGSIVPGQGVDVTLHAGVSQNNVPIAGRKRSREEGFIPEMKRMRTEEIQSSCVSKFVSSGGNVVLDGSVFSKLNDGHTVTNGVGGGSSSSIEQIRNNAAGYDQINEGAQNIQTHSILTANGTLSNNAYGGTSTSKEINGAMFDSSRGNSILSSSSNVVKPSVPQGASGPSNGIPAPVPSPLPGYTGMMGCLDAHYPRCLVGHFF
ncbi:unnamed protein product, partial [Meganyctiphanes norvegica]